MNGRSAALGVGALLITAVALGAITRGAPAPDAQASDEKAQQLIDDWEADPDSLDVGKYLAIIETIGKGRFAQRLASRIKGDAPPDYIKGAIEFVTSRV